MAGDVVKVCTGNTKRMLLRNGLSSPKLVSRRLFSSSSRLLKGINIAFFGSDEFSIASLNKLLHISKTRQDVIDRIDVVTKYPKATGRNFKDITDVPIAKVAESEGLKLIRAETNSEINALVENGYDLAIAVSYGKLIPRKFIETIPYTINVHPSLLPKYAGASPLQYAWINEDRFSGVTIQTLHPTKFDHGEIIAQTGEISISDCEKFKTVSDRLAVEGAELLGKVVESSAYKDVRIKSNYTPSYAPKISPDFCMIDWNSPATKLTRQLEIMKSLFSFKEIDIIKKRKRVHDWRRVIFYDAVALPDTEGFKPGEFKLNEDVVVVQTSKGSIGVKSLKFEYEKQEDATKFMEKLKKRAGETSMRFTHGPESDK